MMRKSYANKAKANEKNFAKNFAKNGYLCVPSISLRLPYI